MSFTSQTLGLVAVLWLSVSIAPTHGVLPPRAASADHVKRETMAGKTVNALTPIDASGGKVSVEGEYWSATSDTFGE